MPKFIISFPTIELESHQIWATPDATPINPSPEDVIRVMKEYTDDPRTLMDDWGLQPPTFFVEGVDFEDVPATVTVVAGDGDDTRLSDIIRSLLIAWPDTDLKNELQTFLETR